MNDIVDFIRVIFIIYKLIIQTFAFIIIIQKHNRITSLND